MNNVIHLSDCRARRERRSVQLTDVDSALASVEELACLSAERLDRLPYGSQAWSWELECWVGFISERFELERMRAWILEEAGNG